MKRNVFMLLTAILCLSLLTGCGCRHEWMEADCTTAKRCSLCEESEGEPLGHSWVDAACETQKTCTVCGETGGEPLGHAWQDAICEAAKTCTVCGKTEGEALEHSWTDWYPVETNVSRSCTLCSTEETVETVHYLQERLQGRWDCTENLLGTSAADLYCGKAPFLDFEEDGTVRYFSIREYDAVLLSCRMECQGTISDGGHTLYRFQLFAGDSDPSPTFLYDSTEDVIYSPSLRFDRESPRAAAIREMLLGKWSFDSVYLYGDTRADIDRSAYAVEFFEDGTFTADLESQIHGTWLYIDDGDLELENETLYSIMVIYDGPWRNSQIVLELTRDPYSVILRFDRRSIERAYFVKE